MRPIQTLAIVWAIAAPALAQMPPQTPRTPMPAQTTPETSPRTDRTMPDASVPPSTATEPSTTNSAAGLPAARPDTWRGTDAEWAKHVVDCGKRHGGYDPATDKYPTPSGGMRTCPR